MPVDTDLLPVAAFRAALLDAIDVGEVGALRLCRILGDPRCPRRIVQAYARRMLAGAKEFVGILSNLVAHAPDDSARGVLLMNLLSEEGVLLIPGQGLVAVPELRHVAWAQRFATACGVEASAAPVSGLDRRISEAAEDPSRWLEVVSFLLLGQESTFGKVAPFIAEALGRRGFAKDDLAFFINHATADTQHGVEALALVVDRAMTVDAQRLSIAAARAGAAAWLDSYR